MDDNEYAPEKDRRPHLSLERHLAVGPHLYQLTATGTGDDRIGLTLVGWNPSGEVVSEIRGGISPADLAPVADALTSTLAGLATLRRQRLTAPPPTAAKGLLSTRERAWPPLPRASAPTRFPDPAAGSPATAPPRSFPPGSLSAWAGSPPPGSARNGATVPLAWTTQPPPAEPPVTEPAEAPPPVKRYRNQGVRWTAEDDQLLITRHQAGARPKQLMEEFGRSRGGITARLEHLGLITPSGTATRRRPIVTDSASRTGGSDDASAADHDGEPESGTGSDLAAGADESAGQQQDGPPPDQDRPADEPKPQTHVAP